MAASGMYWRCSITPVTNISTRHGAKFLEYSNLAHHYSSGMGSCYFDKIDRTGATPAELAELFITRFPDIAEAGKGMDLAYAGWYMEMLQLTYPDALPIAYADYDLPEDYLSTVGGKADIRIPLPPPGIGNDSMDD